MGNLSLLDDVEYVKSETWACTLSSLNCRISGRCWFPLTSYWKHSCHGVLASEAFLPTSCIYSFENNIAWPSLCITGSSLPSCRDLSWAIAIIHHYFCTTAPETSRERLSRQLATARDNSENLGGYPGYKTSGLWSVSNSTNMKFRANKGQQPSTLRSLAI